MLGTDGYRRGIGKHSPGRRFRYLLTTPDFINTYEVRCNAEIDDVSSQLVDAWTNGG